MFKIIDNNYSTSIRYVPSAEPLPDAKSVFPLRNRPARPFFTFPWAEPSNRLPCKISAPPRYVHVIFPWPLNTGQVWNYLITSRRQLRTPHILVSQLRVPNPSLASLQAITGHAAPSNSANHLPCTRTPHHCILQRCKTQESVVGGVNWR